MFTVYVYLHINERQALRRPEVSECTGDHQRGPKSLFSHTLEPLTAQAVWGMTPASDPKQRFLISSCFRIHRFLTRSQISAFTHVCTSVHMCVCMCTCLYAHLQTSCKQSCIYSVRMHRHAAFEGKSMIRLTSRAVKWSRPFCWKA